jgi:hypothetical protein
MQEQTAFFVGADLRLRPASQQLKIPPQLEEGLNQMKEMPNKNRSLTRLQLQRR